MKAILFSEDEFRTMLREERAVTLSQITEALKSSVKASYKKLNAKEAAQFLGISLSTLYKRVKDLPHKKFGKKLIFCPDELKQVTL